MSARIEVYIGDNSMGKTKTLRRILESFGKQECVTNMHEQLYAKLGYDELALEYICDELGCEPVLTKDDVIVFSSEFSRRLNYILTLLCANVRVIVLDEPEHGLNEEETKLVLTALNSICGLNKYIALTTHDMDFTTVGNADIKYIDSEGTHSISRREIFEKMDTVRG